VANIDMNEILDTWLIFKRRFRMWTRGYYWHVDLGFGHVVKTDMKVVACG